MPKSKLTPEQRAEEIRLRFESIYDNTWGLDDSDIEKFKTLSAIELAKEAIFISDKDYNAEWSNRKNYWRNILRILEDKLK